MAANADLQAEPQLFPKHAAVSGVGTTWQRFNMSTKAGAQQLTVFASGACIVATEADGDDDGEAVSAPNKALDASQAASGYVIRLPAMTGQRAAYVLVAAAAGTVDVTLLLEG